ncbi:MAG TPA: ParB/RepB/Spo0J family partition protein [Ktedonobacteraceae bacterium]
MSSSTKRSVKPQISSLLQAGTLKSGAFTADELESEEQLSQEQIQSIPLERLLDNPYQPREQVAIDDELRELATSIKANGFQGVLTARPALDREGSFQLAYGHRRREAARLAGLTHLPISVRELTNKAMAGIAAVENIHRKDLTILELGRLFVRMLDEGYTQEDIAGQIGKDRGYVVNRLRVVRAPADVQRLVLEKPDSLRAVSTLVKVDDSAMRTAMIEALKQGRVTTDDLPGYQTALEQEGRMVRPPSAASPAGNTASSRAGDSDDHTADGQIALDEGTELEQALSPFATDFALMQTRVGQAKLATVLRNLKGYREGLRRRSPLTLSPQEQESLTKIDALLQEIQAVTHTIRQ